MSLFWPITISILAALPSSSSFFAMSKSDDCTVDSGESGAGCAVYSSHNDGDPFVVEATAVDSVGGLWHRHVETTTSTMDEAKRLLGGELPYSHDVRTLAVTAERQTSGRGTSQRAWQSSRRGNSLFTVAVRQSAWMRGTPPTLLPIKIGALVAGAVERYLTHCSHRRRIDAVGEVLPTLAPPRVTVKWPNDVLVDREKIAGILIESGVSKSSASSSPPDYWYLIGIGINVGYAPTVPTEGSDYGRTATSLSRYCAAGTTDDDISFDDAAKGTENAANEQIHEDDDDFWAGEAQRLGMDVAKDLHSWLHADASQQSKQPQPTSTAKAILSEWKSYIDWDMELTLRDTEKREKVKLTDVLPDGRVEVVEVETGLRRTLVADYFL